MLSPPSLDVINYKLPTLAVLALTQTCFVKTVFSLMLALAFRAKDFSFAAEFNLLFYMPVRCKTHQTQSKLSQPNPTTT